MGSVYVAVCTGVLIVAQCFVGDKQMDPCTISMLAQFRGESGGMIGKWLVVG